MLFDCICPSPNRALFSKIDVLLLLVDTKIILLKSKLRFFPKVNNRAHTEQPGAFWEQFLLDVGLGLVTVNFYIDV